LSAGPAAMRGCCARRLRSSRCWRRPRSGSAGPAPAHERAGPCRSPPPFVLLHDVKQPASRLVPRSTPRSRGAYLRTGRCLSLSLCPFACRRISAGLTDAAAGLSPYYFARAFQRFVGVPPHRYLTGVRLRHAARLLDQGAAVTYTCYEVGFGSLSHFVTAFRRRFGVLPSAARRGSPIPPLRAGLSAPTWVKRLKA